MAGDKGAVVDVDAHAGRLHEEISGGELIVLPGVGHMAHYAVPSEILAAINKKTPQPVGDSRYEVGAVGAA